MWCVVVVVGGGGSPGVVGHERGVCPHAAKLQQPEGWVLALRHRGLHRRGAERVLHLLALDAAVDGCGFVG